MADGPESPSAPRLRGSRSPQTVRPPGPALIGPPLRARSRRAAAHCVRVVAPARVALLAQHAWTDVCARVWRRSAAISLHPQPGMIASCSIADRRAWPERPWKPRALVRATHIGVGLPIVIPGANARAAMPSRAPVDAVRPSSRIMRPRPSGCGYPQEWVSSRHGQAAGFIPPSAFAICRRRALDDAHTSAESGLKAAAGASMSLPGVNAGASHATCAMPVASASAVLSWGRGQRVRPGRDGWADRDLGLLNGGRRWSLSRR